MANLPPKEADPVASDALADEVQAREEADAAHAGATKGVHGIADTALLATSQEVQDEASDREAADADLAEDVAAAQATALPKAGGTMTGALVLAGDPSASLEAATRQFVLSQYAAIVGGAPGALDTLKELGDALTAAQEGDEAALEALTALVEQKLGRDENLAYLADVADARTNLGLGSAALQPASAFDLAGAAAAAQAASQPADADLAAIAALATTEFGRSLLTKANAQAVREVIGAQAAIGYAPQAASAYRRLAYMQGRATTSAESGVKYFCSSGSDVSALGNGAASAAYVPISAADLAVSGLTTKLRLRAIAFVGTTAVEVNVTPALYAVSVGGANAVLGEAFGGVTMEKPPKSALTQGVGLDFALPADGVYALGYQLSGKPAGNFIIHVYLEAHNV